MDDFDAALVEFLNGTGEGPEVVRRLARTVAEGRMLDDSELEALNEVLARTPVEVRLEDGGEGRYVLDMRAIADDPREVVDRELAGSFSSLLRRAPDRLKACVECGSFFLDLDAEAARSAGARRSAATASASGAHRARRSG